MAARPSSTRPPSSATTSASPATRRSACASCASRVDEPLRWIAENGGENGYVIVTKVRDAGVGTGYNAATGEYGDLVAQGVLDPVKVTRSALVNATSIAGMLLTTETLIVEKPESRRTAPAAGHGHGHGH